VPLQPIIISILFHHYKELKECISEVKEIEEGRVNHSKKEEEEAWLTVKEQEEEEQETQEQKKEIPTTLDGYLKQRKLLFPLIIPAVILLPELQEAAVT
jgi:Sec-independent protein translocase protein TatA